MASDPQCPARRFVVGLGNPGRKYVETRHNVGFRVLEVLRQRWGLETAAEKFQSMFWQTRRERFDEESRNVVLLAPMTYMNESGRAVRAMMDFYKAQPDEILVVLDDFALPLAQLRLRAKGSAGGHNGLADIIHKCGSDEFPRLRIGIGTPPGVMDVSDYVLGKFASNELEDIGSAINIAADAVEDWVFGDMLNVMQKYNRKSD
ncbi:MAG TPA: aminoacyl-tRNA hydrolase [Phycisphaerae bacterium]|nr:aminoacyl-tRNA hydrolase [Phycisphaerae bacterium]HPS52979.1 aminoacyl-tRNA hydrolase [Phycisphaerae bacterium]